MDKRIDVDQSQTGTALDTRPKRKCSTTSGMTSRKGPIVLMAVGSLLALGPLWGVMGTVIGMIRAFGRLGNADPATPGRLASDLSVSLWSAAFGLMITPIGLALVAGAIIWLVRINKEGKATNQRLQRAEVPPPGPK